MSSLSTEQAEEEELERVLFRLSSVNDDARLETVLFALLPKLLERFESKVHSSKSKEILIQLFNHVTRWVKNPSPVKLPILELAQGITSFSKESPALRVSLVFINIGFSRSDVSVQKACVLQLLESLPKFEESFGQITQLLLPLLSDLTIPSHHVNFVFDLCVDLCFPPQTFPDASFRHFRLPAAGKNYAPIALNYLLRAALENVPNSQAPALVASILCFATDAGKEGVKRIRGICDSQSEVENEPVIAGLFELVLGSSTRMRGPLAARVLAVELLSRMVKTLSDSLCKVILSGLVSANVPSSFKRAVLLLLKETALIFPQTGPLDALISNALRQQAMNVAHEDRSAFFTCFASWVRSRALNFNTATLCLLLLQTHDPLPEMSDALHAILAKLPGKDIKILAESSITLDYAEGDSAEFKSVVLEIAKLGVKESIPHAIWILLAISRPMESRDLRESARHALAGAKPIASFDFIFKLAQERHHDRDALFFPQVFSHLVQLVKPECLLIDEFVETSLRFCLGNPTWQVSACDAVFVLLTRCAWKQKEHVFQLLTFSWLKNNLESSHAELRFAASKLVPLVFALYKDPLVAFALECLQTPQVSQSSLLGALAATGQFPIFNLEIVEALERWLLFSNKSLSFPMSKEAIDMALNGLAHLLLLQESEQSYRPSEALTFFAKSNLKDVSSSCPSGAILFVGRVLNDADSLLDMVLLESSNALAIQLAVGQALQGNHAALDKVIQKCHMDISKRQRSAFALVLEQMTKSCAAFDVNKALEVQEAFLTLLLTGDQDDKGIAQLACFRGIAQVYFRNSSNSGMQEQLTMHLLRRLSLFVTLNRQLQELRLASTQSGNSSLLFYLLALAAGDFESFPSSDFRVQLDKTNHARLVTQFLRRRHVEELPLVQRVSRAVFPPSLTLRQILGKEPETIHLVFTTCSQLLRNSFLAYERRSAVLTMVDCLNVENRFITSAVETWKDVFRALDDLDESVAKHTTFGHVVKQLTLKTVFKDEEEEVFEFLFTSGLGSSVIKIRQLTRLFFMDAIASKRLPAKFAVRLIESLLRTIGESESLELQYAQFHTRGGLGTGEVAMDFAKLEELRCQLALNTVEYKAILECVQHLITQENLPLFFQALGRTIRQGIGLVTLASAVTLVQYLCAETQWAEKDEDMELLRALTYQFLKDPSVELKRRIAMAAAHLVNIGKGSEVEKMHYFMAISKLYDEDAEQSQANRLLAGQACKAVLVQRRIESIVPEPLIRVIYLGGWDEDADVSSMWKECWNMVKKYVDPLLLVEISTRAIHGLSYRQRRQGAQSLLSLPSEVVESVASQNTQLASELLRLTTNSSTWNGKEEVIRCTGVVLQFVRDGACVNTAWEEMMAAAVCVSPIPSKWILSALFQALGNVAKNPLLALDQRVRWSRRLMEYTSPVYLEPLVATALLQLWQTLLSRADFFQSESRGILHRMDTDFLTSHASWNVKVSCFQLLASMAKTTSPNAFDFPDSIWDKTIQILQEEKKPSVLVAALMFLNHHKSPHQLSQVGTVLNRLEQHADPSVSALAHSIGTRI